MAVTAVRVKALMSECWTGDAELLGPRIKRFVEVVTEGLTDAGIRVCTIVGEDTKCAWPLDPMIEVYAFRDDKGNPYTNQFFAQQLLLYVNDGGDPGYLAHVMDQLPIGEEFPFASWRPAELLTSRITE
jgi:hypothetical protein